MNIKKSNVFSTEQIQDGAYPFFKIFIFAERMITVKNCK